ncbi:MAG: 30S ribosomal protein S12 methylthiotransferase RimO [Lachnospiraceae bacterium]|nr:30S ribosomal protein S12 methylthiotransferase RimO [Lachnospiraceae bacterium]
MKILFVSLGCDKNLTNSEEMLGLLYKNGFTFTDNEEEAEVIVVNTCAFINDAKEESINTIIELAEYKKTGSLKALIVTGCLAERYKSEIIKEIPEVDAVIGTSAYDEIVFAVNEAVKGKKTECYKDLNRLVETDADRIITTGGYYAHLKIAEGCNKRCTYCIIPKMRGNYRSVPMEKLVKEAEYLAAKGVKELILVAQETTVYGIDLYGKKSLHILLDKLCEVKGIEFIRIMYCYPEEIYDELIYTIKNQRKICKYIDMPIQHCNDEILKKMGRKTGKAQLINMIERLRKEIPDIILRTTLISGFPGETDEQHEELMEFVDSMEFDRLGVFAYSPEEDTVAAEMDNQIEESVKEDRRDEIMELQQEIAFEKGDSMIGREFVAIIEGKLADENAYVGRTYMDAPGIDGNIFITTDEEIMTGDFVRVKVTGSLEYDLIGELL